MNDNLKLPSIYSFTNYREYLANCLEHYKTRNVSIRSVARNCGITSPNYFQQVIGEQRNMTPLIATRMAEAFALSPPELEYFLTLLKLSRARTNLMKESALKKMRVLVQKSERKLIEDKGFHSIWCNALVWELFKTRHHTRDPEAIRELLRHAATVEEIESSIAYFEKKEFLTAAAAETFDFKPSNDIRRIDLQRSHLRFLQLAEHRLNDPLDQREFQGLTVAMKKESFDSMRKLCREFISQINEQFAADADGDEVIRVQLCAFKLSRDS